MSSFPLKPVLLPAVLVSSAVFTALLLTFISRNSAPVAIDVPPPDVEQTQPRQIQQISQLSIRQVGLAVILSAGVGVATAEVLRKWHAFHTSAQAKVEEFGLQYLFQDSLPSDPSAVDEISDDNSLQPMSEVELPLQTFADRSTTQHLINSLPLADLDEPIEFLDEPVVETPTSPVSLPSTPLKTGVDKFAFDDPRDTPWSTANALSSSGVLPSARRPTIVVQILESPEQYKTCRVRLPYLEHRQFAVVYNDQYYCLVRRVENKEKALKTVNQLVEKGEQAIISQLNRGFAVWMLEPDAYPELMN